MEEIIQESTPLSVYINALTCTPTVYTWKYDPEGNLLENNSPIHVYHRIFEHTGCLAYMLEKGREDTRPLILSAELGILWSAVFRHEDGELKTCYVIGPVFNTEVSHELIRQAIHWYRVDPAWHKTFYEAMINIPAVSSVLFFQYAVLLHYFVTGEKITRSDLNFQSTPEQVSVPRRRTNRLKTYRAEQALLQMIREGNLNYQSAMEQAGLISSGVSISTADPVRRAIVSSLNFTALCTRAAIDGGLTPDTAYTVGDSYIQSMMECRTISDVRTMNHTMYEDFIRRVHRLREQPSYSAPIQNCVSFIETHPDEELSLNRLADLSGYSEYHLSRRFKEETGTNIRDYIRHARIERAKTLLSTTEISVKKIAEMLCFCSSGHFSATFQKETGILPQQYRKEHYK